MTSYRQQTPAAPSGPSTSSASTRNSKLDQIIQNFYTKTAQIVIQARCTPCNDTRYSKTANTKGSSSNKKMNKWFNIATEDIELLREDLKYWRTMAIQSTEEKEPPPMILDIYLDTSRLSHNQSLVVADDNLRWGCVELTTADAHHIDRILIESWELSLKHPFPEYAVDLPNLYKRSIVFFRSLHSLCRLLPSYDLFRALHKTNDSTNSLSIGYRLSTSSLHGKSTEISLDTSIIESDARKPTKFYEFNDIVTPIGTFKLNVKYRRNCDFRIEDSERDLSAQFIDMDEQFFTPTMAKYQQQKQKQKQRQEQQRQQDSDEYFRSSVATSARPVSMFARSSPRASLESKLETAMKQSPTNDNFRPSPHTTMSKNAPTDSSMSKPFSSGSRNTAESTGDTSSNRRASAPFVVSPFKSPFLSSSPQAESIFSGAGSGGSTRHFSSTVSSEKSRPVDSGSFGKKIEFSSSFDKYKSSPTNRTASATADSPSSTGMMRRWSRASDHSSINVKAEYDDHDDDDDGLRDFVRLVGSNHELHLFQEQRSNSATQMLSSASDSASSAGGGSSMMMNASMTKKAALSHFQSLRETHNSLSDSLTSSMLIGNVSASSAGVGAGSASTSSQHHDPVTGISPVSSTSSTGRSYQPIIPSPLHAEQRSASPVHIPRSYPQLRSLTNPQNALRLARLHPAEGSHHPEHTDDDDDDPDFDSRRRQGRREASVSSSYGSGNNDMSAFSTYPQGHHNQNLNILKNTATAATTGHTGGRATGTPISYNQPMPRDEGQQQQQQQHQQYQQQQEQQQKRRSAGYQSQKSQPTMDSSDNSLIQDNANASSGPTRANNSSLMDDDDSLVFKMSELEFEGPPPPHSPSFITNKSSGASSSPSPSKQHDIFRYNGSGGNNLVFSNQNSISSSSTAAATAAAATSPPNATNNRVNEHFLELTPTPLSPPLLHRLQNISMSTVTEEEERASSGLLNASGSSNKSDSDAPTSNPVKSSHLMFDAW
ncbi:autophagy-related protein 13-domain-containing protein [Parasitella parasitica]|nr:autophagy-related protein 13-domain-containing protein [Parasitella parasitica]